MKQLPSRLRRLDDALASLPLDEPMLLTELDGFLSGLVICSEPVPPEEWLPFVWGNEASGVAPLEDPADVQWFRSALIARHDEISRDLGRGKYLPIFDVDERSGDLLWEPWIDAFDAAMALRPKSWQAVDEAAADALSYLSLLIAIARDESGLDAQQINTVHDEAPEGIIAAVGRLHAVRCDKGRGQSPAPSPAKAGRNEPCPCGSGKKSKRCCG